jgi:hypothetical protein
MQGRIRSEKAEKADTVFIYTLKGMDNVLNVI